MNLKRIFRHLFYSPFFVKRVFSNDTLKKITHSIADSERKHLGQIRFAVEANLDALQLIKNQAARERAIEVFSNLRVWDTEQNCGVLIYLLYADRDVEIVADRGVNSKVPQTEWEAICQQMEEYFRRSQFEEGVLIGIKKIDELLTHHFPGKTSSINELSDQAMVI